jgi:hypothetical protein
MKKTLWAAATASTLLTLPLSAAINLFRTSIPAQAAVNSVFVFDTWDYLVTPAFYSWQKEDAISAVYTPDQYDKQTFVMGGRNTLGIPLYWTVGLKNERSKSQNYDPTQQASFESTTGQSHFRGSLGTKFSTFGVGLIGEYLDNAIVRKDTNDGTTYSAGAEINDKTSNRIRAGLNIGQSLDRKIVWSLGVAMRQNGGTFDQTTAGAINSGTLASALTAGQLRRPQNTQYLEATTFGWITLTARGERVYWRGNFSHQLKGDVDVRRTTGTTIESAKLDENDNRGEAYVGYAMAWPLSDVARFYIGPEIGATYSAVTTMATNGAQGFSGGILGFTGNSQRLQENNTTIAGKFNLPIVFQLPVVANILTLQAGWYPEITVYTETAREQTDSLANPAKTVDARSSRYLQASVEKYGAGLTYTPVNRLRIHLLFTTINNSDAVGQTDRVDVSRVSVGVDYVFASDPPKTAAAAASTPTTPGIL